MREPLSQEEMILYLAWKHEGNFYDIIKALKDKKPIDTDEVRALARKQKSQWTTIISKDYPKRLMNIDAPPIVLFYYGNLDLVNERTLGVIGTRRPSDYGQSVTQELVGDAVNQGLTIVSGMALGIDGIAHRAAYNHGGKTIAVLGGGIDCVYPKTNKDIYERMKDDQLIVSEVPFDIAPERSFFPRRNRIIAGLSDKILVSEAQERSGTMITVGYALDQGKDVLCVPGRIGDAPGTMRMIQTGAKLVLSINDIMEEYG